MENAITVALSRLTPYDHKECLRILIAAQIPLPIISRIIFLPHQSRRMDRRQDRVMATVINRARGILHCSNEQDARAYLLLKQVPSPLIQRALYGYPHRDL